LYSDADGQYQNANGDVLKMKRGQRYTVFSLWDTFRAENPLLALTQPERYLDILNSMLAFGDENGYLPIWDLSTWETGCMSGYHAIPTLADAILTNYPGLDAQRAYTQMRKTAFQDRRGTKEYIKYGFLPQDKAGNSASVTLEYAYDDWCIAQVAKKLNKLDDYNSIMVKALGDRIAEALAELTHKKVREIFGFGKNENLSTQDLIKENYRGIRPAPGYPACPDHTEKIKLFELLNATENIGVELTESLAMNPPASVCGWYIAHPQSHYFGLGKIGKDQLEDYAKRKGMSIEEAERWLRPNLE